VTQKCEVYSRVVGYLSPVSHWNEGKKEEWEVYSRVVGYLSPVSHWNEGKKEEWDDRAEYNRPEVKQ